MKTLVNFTLLPALLLSSFILGGCPQYHDLPAGTVREISESAVIESQTVEIPPPSTDAEPGPSKVYSIGAGDLLAIHVRGVTDLPKETVDEIPTFRVFTSGKAHLPLLGSVKVAGLSMEELQKKLVVEYGEYLKNPRISVEILEHKSQPIYLLGRFNNPGVHYLDRSITLLQGMVLGGGPLDSANLRGARLVRDQETVPVDIYDLLYKGDLDQNIRLETGDTIYLPGNEQTTVFVLGAVKEQGPIPMPNGRLSLIQALSTAGLGDGGYDHHHIRLIRSHSPTRGELMVVDLGRIMAGETLPLSLQDGDIIYVPRTGVGDWNQALSDLLPTLQTFSAVLQPFVQIKFLND